MCLCFVCMTKKKGGGARPLWPPMATLLVGNSWWWHCTRCTCLAEWSCELIVTRAVGLSSRCHCACAAVLARVTRTRIRLYICVHDQTLHRLRLVFISALVSSPGVGHCPSAWYSHDIKTAVLTIEHQTSILLNVFAQPNVAALKN